MDSKRVMYWSFGGLGVMTVARWVGIALAPTLLTYSPLLFIALSPLPAHVVLAATVTPMVPLVLVTTVRRAAASVLIYLVGRSFGDSGVPWVRARYPRSGKFLDRLIKVFEFGGPLAVVVLPLHLIAALAGATRMSIWSFIPAVTLGHALWAYLTFRLGDRFRDQIQPIVAFMREHMLQTTLGFMTFVAVYWLVQRRRQRTALQDLQTVPVQALQTPPPNTTSPDA